MEAQIIEGTFAEIQRQLLAMSFTPETRFRIIVTEPDVPNVDEEEFLRNARRRNGLILVPNRSKGKKVSPELVKELSED